MWILTFKQLLFYNSSTILTSFSEKLNLILELKKENLCTLIYGNEPVLLLFNTKILKNLLTVLSLMSHNTHTDYCGSRYELRSWGNHTGKAHCSFDPHFLRQVSWGRCAKAKLVRNTLTHFHCFMFTNLCWVLHGDYNFGSCASHQIHGTSHSFHHLTLRMKIQKSSVTAKLSTQTNPNHTL